MVFLLCHLSACYAICKLVSFAKIQTFAYLAISKGHISYLTSMTGGKQLVFLVDKTSKLLKSLILYLEFT